MNRRLLLGSLLAAACAAHGMAAGMAAGTAAGAAAGEAPGDFARGRTVTAADDGAILRLEVPADVYEWTTREDLGDLRLFDATGTELPHALRRVSRPETPTPWQQLPLFPLPAPAEPRGDDTAVDIQLGSDGTVVAVRGGKPGPHPASYLLDASALAQPVTELVLHWPEAATSFVSRLRLEASDDLDRWRTLTESATVASLTAGDQRVLVNRLAVPATRAGYLRLSQLDPGRLPALSSAEARGHSPGPLERHWKTLSPKPADGGYEFDTGGHFPTDRVRATQAGASYLLDVRLLSRAHPSHRWQDHGRYRFYRVPLPETGAAEAEVTSDPAVLPRTTHRYWRLEILDGGTGAPALEIGWLPNELLFVSGQPPYLLAYGRAGAEARIWPLEDLAARLGEDLSSTIPAASVEPPRMLGGPRRLEPPPRAVNWKTVLLWSLLLAGVTLVGLLALRLVRSAGRAPGTGRGAVRNSE